MVLPGLGSTVHDLKRGVSLGARADLKKGVASVTRNQVDQCRGEMVKVLLAAARSQRFQGSQLDNDDWFEIKPKRSGSRIPDLTETKSSN